MAAFAFRHDEKFIPRRGKSYLAYHSEMTFECQMTAQARPSRQQRSFFVQNRNRFVGLRFCVFCFDRMAVFLHSDAMRSLCPEGVNRIWRSKKVQAQRAKLRRQCWIFSHFHAIFYRLIAPMTPYNSQAHKLEFTVHFSLRNSGNDHTFRARSRQCTFRSSGSARTPCL